MDLSLQLQSPSSSQIPLVWPRVTQLAVQAKLPSLHRNPPLTMLVVASNTNTGLSVVFPNILWPKIKIEIVFASVMLQSVVTDSKVFLLISIKIKTLMEVKTILHAKKIANHSNQTFTGFPNINSRNKSLNF